MCYYEGTLRIRMQRGLVILRSEVQRARLVTNENGRRYRESRRSNLLGRHFLIGRFFYATRV